jgi:hypothetical protein
VTSTPRPADRRLWLGLALIAPTLGVLWMLPALLERPDLVRLRLPGWLLVLAALTLLGLCLSWASLRGPHLLRVASANLLGFGILLLAGEAASQLLGHHVPAVPRPRQGGDRGAWTYDPVLGWYHRPNSTGRSDLGGPDSGSFRINSLGLRGPEVTSPKPPGCRRVLVCGDSFVFGVGVDEGHLLSSWIARLLAERTGGCVDAVNMGVSGYATDQEYLLLQRLGAHLQPDLVVLVVCDNDFEGNQLDFAFRRYFKPHFVLDGAGRLIPDPRPPRRLTRWQRVKAWMGQESNVWNLIRTRSSDVAALQRFFELFEVALARRTPRPLKLTGALVEAFAEHARELGARVLVLNTGHRGEDRALFEILRGRLTRHGFDVLGISELLQQQRWRDPGAHWDFQHDTHWNRDAHEFVARHVVSHLIATGLFEARPRDGDLRHADATSTR